MFFVLRIQGGGGGWGGVASEGLVQKLRIGWFFVQRVKVDRGEARRPSHPPALAGALEQRGNRERGSFVCFVQGQLAYLQTRKVRREGERREEIVVVVSTKQKGQSHGRGIRV